LALGAGQGASSPAVLQHAVVHTGTSHGRFVVGPADLFRISRSPVTRLSDEEKDQDAEEGPSRRLSPCTQSICGEPVRATRDKVLQSPKPTTSAVACCVGQIDPQIASSGKGYLVVGMRDHIYLYGKGGRPLYPKQSVTPGPTVAGPRPLPVPYGQIDLCDLFAPMIPDANAHLGLPTTKTDHEGHKITVRNGYGINCDAATGGVEPPGWSSNQPFYQKDGQIYDARVLWDEYHKRFWIAALFKNNNTAAYIHPDTSDPMMLRPATRSANVRSARRALLAIAVSKSQDPRDGWYLSWVFGLPGQEGCPNSKACVGFATDYLSMGITSKYLTMESLGSIVPSQGDGGRVITIVPTEPLAAGTGALYFQPDPKTLGHSLLQPAVQHAPDFDHGKEALFAAPVYNLDDGAAGNEIQISAVQPQASPYVGVPKIVSQLVTVRTFNAVSGSQPEQGGGSITVARNQVNKLVYRDSNLYLTMDECQWWDAKGCRATAIRLIRLHLTGVVRLNGVLSKLKLAVADDQTIGGSVGPFSPGGATWFGFPSAEVNKEHDIVVAYHGTSTTIFPDARYSVWEHGEKDVRSSRVLEHGQAAVSDWHHYLGMSVDGFDRTAIWMITGYGDKSNAWGYAFGKVLGKRVADLEPLQAYVDKTTSTTKPFQLTLVLDNLGDGAAPVTTGRLTLTRRGSPNVRVTSFTVPALAPGALSTPVIVPFAVPAAANSPGYSLQVDLDTKHQLAEYDESNNSISIAAP
jgi:hypothetical protein